MVSISSTCPIIDIGISVANILKVFKRLMTCSTSIGTFAINEVLLTSYAVIWVAPLFPGGTMKCKQLAAQPSTILKRVSAIMLLYLGAISKNSDFSGIALSLILPMYASEVNLIQ